MLVTLQATSGWHSQDTCRIMQIQWSCCRKSSVCTSSSNVVFCCRNTQWLRFGRTASYSGSVFSHECNAFHHTSNTEGSITGASGGRRRTNLRFSLRGTPGYRARANTNTWFGLEFGEGVVSNIHRFTTSDVLVFRCSLCDQVLQGPHYWRIESTVYNVSVPGVAVMGVSRYNSLTFSHRIRIHESCPRCGKAQPPSSETGSIPSARRICQNCRRRIGLCFLCHEPVKGLYTWCSGCGKFLWMDISRKTTIYFSFSLVLPGHGGHVECAIQWFGSISGEKKREVCPTGCGHRCNLVQTVTAFPRMNSMQCVPVSTMAVKQSMGSRVLS